MSLYVRLHPPNASDIEIAIQRCEKCQSLSSSANLSDDHSSMTRRKRSKGKLHIFDFLFGTDESAYNAVIILIIAHPSFTTFLSHMLFTPRFLVSKVCPYTRPKPTSHSDGCMNSSSTICLYQRDTIFDLATYLPSPPYRKTCNSIPTPLTLLGRPLNFRCPDFR
ncbi:uncharacterized protein K441DRAFT_152527 [Cenococcum geophilum 1.58]|uniref:uncharacterized protein n=1 Tax=Cenococcum geophilum 1.58 TaxID=794803 RepID=UPI00358EE0CD|nr:hypothetical protein K441DRAFT_152527 [Cenococcum geophilum 1.58]